MNINDYIDKLTSQGRHCFTTEQAMHDLGRTRSAVLEALRRLQKKNIIATPHRGYNLIILPQYRKLGSLPATHFIDSLMKYLKQDYYVGLLSAAEFYAAAHQKPQELQVVTPIYLRKIKLGGIRIRFISKKKFTKITKQFPTPTGYVDVATPELSAVDLVAHPNDCGGINNIATVITELAESMNNDKLGSLLEKIEPEKVVMQRLGYILDTVGNKQLADTIHAFLQQMDVLSQPLVPGLPLRGCHHNKRWQLHINYKIEPDL